MHLALILILSLILTAQAATTNYVDSVSGSDANPGTEAQPWQTSLNVNTGTFSDGYTILFKRGTTLTVSGLYGLNFRANNATFDAYGVGVNPIINGGGNVPIVVYASNRVGTLTQNLIITNGGPVGVTNTGALWQCDSTGTNTLRNCTLAKQSIDCGVASGSGWIILDENDISECADEAVTLHGTGNAVITGGAIHNNVNAFNNSGTGGTLVCNGVDFYENSNADLDDLGTWNSTFYGCRFLGFPTATTWSVYKGSSGGTTRFQYCFFDLSGGASTTQPSFTLNASAIEFSNNTIYGGASSTRGHFAWVAGTVRATNNIVYRVTRYINLLGGNFESRNDLYYAVPSNANSTNSAISGAINSDPLFTNAAGSDFTLTSISSPAYNAALDIDLVLDLAGNAVGNSPDIGAYEYQVPVVPFTGAVTVSGGVTIGSGVSLQ